MCRTAQEEGNDGTREREGEITRTRRNKKKEEEEQDGGWRGNISQHVDTGMRGRNKKS